MRIGVDIKCLRTNNSGIGRYTRSLLDALQEVDLINEYVLFSPSPVDYKPTNPKWRSVVVPTKLPGILWQQLALPLALKDEHIDVIWGPEQTIPVRGLGRIKSILTIHDFVYRRYPDTMRRSVLWITRIFGGLSIKKADEIIPVSEFTKGELAHFYPKADLNKVDVVSCGVKLPEERSAEKECQAPDCRKDQLLFAGSLEPRKNLPALIQALEILQKKGIEVPLVLTGPQGWKNLSVKDMLKKSPVAQQIQHKGFVSDEELDSLYRESAAVVFPSVYEGFGLPILEAVSRGTPVLTSQGTVMESILGDCGIYFNPNSPESIAKAIEEFWGHRTVISSKLAEQYTWENSARKLIDVFQKVYHG